MQTLPPTNLHARLVRLVMGAVLATMLVFALFSGPLQLRFFGQITQDRLAVIGQQLAQALQAPMAQSNFSASQTTLDTLLPQEPAIIHAQVFDRLNKPVAQYSTAQGVNPQNLIFGRFRTHTHTEPIVQDARTIGQVAITVSTHQLIGHLLQSLAWVAGALLVLLWWARRATRKVARHITAPMDQQIQQLQDQLLEQRQAQAQALSQHTQQLQQAQQAVDQAQQAAQAAQEAKSQFLAHMSHDILTPMNGLLGMLDLLQDLNLTPQQQQQYIQGAKSSSLSLLHTVNDIFDIAKLEVNQLQLTPHNGNLVHTLEALVLGFQSLATHNQIELKLHIDPNLPSNIFCDFRRLTQILSNLVANAFKFTRQGHISIQATKRLDAAQPLLQIAIKDTGIGLPSSTIQALFKPFETVSKSTTPIHHGTGIGLAIAHQLVTAMGGRIMASSQIGKGSTFTVELPLQASTPTQASPANTPAHSAEATPHQHPLNDLHVLVAEDHTVNQLLVRALLEKAGCTVEVANNGLEAVRFAMAKRYDAILMDCEMPIVDGYQATQQIRAWEANQRIAKPVPIVAVTANTLRGDRDKCLQHGMTHYLSKPYSPSELYLVLGAC
jgi:signal transduction histidine kinase/ActR/RegA family two-component response regulator